MIPRTTMMMVTLLMLMCGVVDGMGQDTWVKTFGGRYSDYGDAVTVTSEGGVLITGQTESNDGDLNIMNKGGTDIFIINLDKYGNVR